jgi:NitT/TauT family transport system permease protein
MLALCDRGSVMIVIVVIGLLADKIVFAPWERFLHRRWGTGRA